LIAASPRCRCANTGGFGVAILGWILPIVCARSISLLCQRAKRN
jgi:hypothetical protein